MAYQDTPFLLRRPKTIAMVGLGPSANAYWLECAQWDSRIPWEEVWVINRASSAFVHDAAFNNHDLRELVQKAPQEELRLMKADKPIITPKAYPEYPMSVEYPIRQVIDFLKHDLLSSTAGLMLGYAMMIGVKTIYLYGMDFHYENLAHAEAGGQGMAYLLGMCQVLGIDFKIPSTSSLLDAYKVVLANGVPMRPIYGYELEGPGPRDPRVPAEGAKVIRPPHLLGTMNVQDTPRLRFGEAEKGDLPVDGHLALEAAKA